MQEICVLYLQQSINGMLWFFVMTNFLNCFVYKNFLRVWEYPIAIDLIAFKAPGNVDRKFIMSHPKLPNPRKNFD